jgi:hypothetical protein
MSFQAINQYHNDVAKNQAFTGKNHEQTLNSRFEIQTGMAILFLVKTKEV